jgi:hypothetical protein
VNRTVVFMSSSDRRLHLGPGQETSVGEIQVHWPGGAVRKLTDIAADRIRKSDEP